MDVPNPNSGITHTGEGDVCPSGHQCPVGSSFPTPCPAGEYSPSTALALCSVCPEGEIVFEHSIDSNWDSRGVIVIGDDSDGCGNCGVSGGNVT